ncbi:MAG: dicarboxylate/amino acid:cation symporter [Candidatus Sericytochromatia bacterium]|nr:dicarboxylate/amino acid:cation symporter [Candidatus Sericytochromatia bacterium]
MSRHTQILFGMLTGLALGLFARLVLEGDPQTLTWLVKNVATPLGQVFMNSVFMVVVPLVVTALTLGVAEVGDVGRVGRMGLRTLGLTVVFSSLAVVIGLAAVNVTQPGLGLSEADRQVLLASVGGPEAAQQAVSQAAQAKGWAQTLVDLIPRNPFAEAVNAFQGGLLPLMVFALALGAALSSLKPERAAPLKDWLESVFLVMLKVIEFAMTLAPLGVAGLMFAVAATLGVQTVWLLGKYVAVVLGALVFHQVVVYGLGVRLIARRDPVQFFKDLRETMLTAFSTSSSAATLPTAMRAATENLMLPRRVSHFVLTIGATANQNGTALYEGVTVLFLAQLFGVHLDLGQQVTVMGLAVLAGVGTAGVPGGSLPMIVIVLGTIGVPGAAIGLILGIDRLLDMCRTVLNVTGDLAIAACVAATEPAEGPDDAGPRSLSA